MAKKSVTFENSMKRLDEIVTAMETGNISLEESVKLFEEGTKLAAQCSEMLDKAELKVTELTQSSDTEPVEEELSDEQL